MKNRKALRLVAQPLLMAIKLHAFTAFMFGYFSFTFLFNGSHGTSFLLTLINFDNLLQDELTLLRREGNVSRRFFIFLYLW